MYNYVDENGVATIGKLVDEKINEVKQDLVQSVSENIIGGMSFSIGAINASTGNNVGSQARIRTDNYVPDIASKLSTIYPNNCIYVYAWDSEGTFVGTYDISWGQEITEDAFVIGGGKLQETVDFVALRKVFPTYKFKFVYVPKNGTVSESTSTELTLTNATLPSEFISDDTVSKFKTFSSEKINKVIEEKNVGVLGRMVEKIRIMQNNLGGFNFGVKTSKLTTEEALAKVENYKQFYAEYQPNIVCFQEFPMDSSSRTKYIDLGESVDVDEVLYNNIYKFSSEAHQYTSIKSDFEITENRKIGIALDGFEYSLKANIIGFTTNTNKKCGAMSVVFDVNGTVENRKAQIEKSIELMSNYDYAFICADTNMLSEEEIVTMMETFSNADYQCCNGGFYGSLPTCPNAIFTPIDNIFVKGNAKIKAVNVPQVYDTLASDHLPIIADILLY